MEAHEYVLKLSLQQMALRKIAIILWNRFYNDSFRTLSPRQQAEEPFLTKQVQEKVPMLSLPSFLEDKLMNIVSPIVSEIQIWRDCHRYLVPQVNISNELDQLCWTSQGTVDYSKTAERLIRLERVDTVEGFKLSCLYCLEDEVQRFWIQLPERYKKLYYRDELLDEEFWPDRKRAKLETFWSRFLEGNTDSIVNQFDDAPRRTFFQYAFESAALRGNKIATEYFSQKVTFKQRETSVLKVIGFVLVKRCVSHKQNFLDFPLQKRWSVVSYLLSQMSKDQQIEVFKKYSLATLVCFLDCPWQDLFMKIAGHMWEFLSISVYRGLLAILSENYCGNCNYKNIFVDFFLQTPSNYRNNLFKDLPTNLRSINMFSYSIPNVYSSLNRHQIIWFSKLFWTNNSERIKLVLRNVNIDERERLILSTIGVNICKSLVMEKKWQLLELFVKECELSIKAKRSLKNRLGKSLDKERGQKGSTKKCLQLIDNLDRIVSNKRNIEELESEQPISSKQKTIKITRKK